jgi:UPF0755 protein
MRLQSDPTVIYGMVGGKGALDGPLTEQELEEPSPYNTYLIKGLPPGPITTPGRASLEAAANPARTRDLYFVADGSGGHVFARTYQQHLKNVRRLRQIEAAQNVQSSADADPKVSVVRPASAPADRHHSSRRKSHLTRHLGRAK